LNSDRLIAVVAICLAGVAVFWAVPVYLENQGLKTRVDNLSLEVARLSVVERQYENLTRDFGILKGSAQMLYARLQETYDKWQADRIVSWYLYTVVGRAYNASTSDPFIVTFRRKDFEDVVTYIHTMNLSYSDIAEGNETWVEREVSS